MLRGDYLDIYAWMLYQFGNYKKAQKYLEKALDKDSPDTNGEMIKHYDDVLYELGQYEKAVEQWRHAQAVEGASKHIHQKIKHRQLIP